MNNSPKKLKRYTKAAIRPFVKKGSKLVLSRALNKVGASNPRVKCHVKISGSDKGKITKVLEVFQDGKILVEGVNVKVKHKKAAGPGSEGEIIKLETPIFASKVMIWDEKSKKATRVAKKIQADGAKVRVSKVSGDNLD
jgi:large subunit ribosomal protein L24